MTTVTILGEAQGVEPKKKIEFVKHLSHPNEEITDTPPDYENIQLIAKDYLLGLDFMVAWDDECIDSRLCVLGHFNDGIV